MRLFRASTRSPEIRDDGEEIVQAQVDGDVVRPDGRRRRTLAEEGGFQGHAVGGEEGEEGVRGCCRVEREEVFVAPVLAEVMFRTALNSWDWSIQSCAVQWSSEEKWRRIFVSRSFLTSERRFMMYSSLSLWSPLGRNMGSRQWC